MFKTHPSFYVFLLSTILLFTSNIGFGQCPAKTTFENPAQFIIEHSSFDVNKRYSAYKNGGQGAGIVSSVPLTEDGVNNNPFIICKGTTLTVVPYTGVSGIRDVDARFNFIHPVGGGTVNVFALLGLNRLKREHKYDNLGDFYLLMVNNVGATNYYACQHIRVVDPSIAPDVTLKSCSDSEIEVIFPADPNERPFEKYEITMGGTSSTFLLDSPFLPTDRTSEAIYKQSSGVLGESNVEVKVKGVVNDEEACLSNQTPLAEFSQFVTVGAPLPAHTLKSLEEVDGTPNRFKLSYLGKDGVKFDVFSRTNTGAYDYTQPPFKSGKSTITVPGPTEETLDLPSTTTAQTCFKLVPLSLCGARDFTKSIGEICTLPFTLTAGEKKNEISWTPYPIASGFQRYKITRYEGTTAGTSKDLPVGALPIGSSSFTDEDGIKCGVDYLYRITAEIGGTGITESSVSIQKTIKGVSTATPYPITYALAAAEYVKYGQSDKKYVKVTAAFDTLTNPEPKPDEATGELKYYNLYKVTNNVPLLLGTSTNTFIVDSTANIDKQSYCYQLSWTNKCMLESARTPTVCSIHLSANGQVLNWTDETPFSSNVLSYEVLAFNEPQVTNTIKQVDVNLNSNWLASLTELPASLGQRLYFRITSRAQVYANGQSSSNIVEVYRPPVIQVPSVFTPNGDGTNDVFTLNGVYIKKVKMSIFDRWGNLIYKTETDNFDPTDPSFGWSGYMPNGELAKEDTYAYKMDIEDSDVTGPKKFVKEGAIVLMR